MAAPEVPRPIHEIMTELRAHPDYGFAAVFEAGDFPGGKLPDDINHNYCAGRLTELGNEIIEDLFG